MRKFKYSIAVSLLVMLAGCGEKAAEVLPPGVCPATKAEATACMKSGHRMGQSFEFAGIMADATPPAHLCPGVSDDLYFCAQAFVETGNWPATIPPRQPLLKGECPAAQSDVCNVRYFDIYKKELKFIVRSPGDRWAQQNAQIDSQRQEANKVRCPATVPERYFCREKAKREKAKREGRF